MLVKEDEKNKEYKLIEVIKQTSPKMYERVVLWLEYIYPSQVYVEIQPISV